MLVGASGTASIGLAGIERVNSDTPKVNTKVAIG